MICTCRCRRTAEAESGVASAGVAAGVVAETATRDSGASLGLFRSRTLRQPSGADKRRQPKQAARLRERVKRLLPGFAQPAA
jgi:hypothetical protein